MKSKALSIAEWTIILGSIILMIAVILSPFGNSDDETDDNSDPLWGESSDPWGENTEFSHFHNYADKPEEQYLKNAATCTSPAVYFKSCTGCGEKGKLTFKYGDPIPHDFTEEDTSHQYLATKATCTEKATYYYSCAGCGAKSEGVYEAGDINPNVHTGETVTMYAKMNDDYHIEKTVCAGCHETIISSTKPHIIESGVCINCE